LPPVGIAGHCHSIATRRLVITPLDAATELILLPATSRELPPPPLLWPAYVSHYAEGHCHCWLHCIRCRHYAEITLADTPLRAITRHAIQHCYAARERHYFSLLLSYAEGHYSYIVALPPLRYATGGYATYELRHIMAAFFAEPLRLSLLYDAISRCRQLEGYDT